MSQAIAFTLHVSAAYARYCQFEAAASMDHIGAVPKLWRVNNSPEKHIAAIPTKKINSAIIARSALE